MNALSLACAALVAVAGGLVATAAEAQSSVKAGTLNCEVSGGAGLIIASVKDLACSFKTERGEEHYHGTIRKFGLDIGATTKGVLIWAVFAPTVGLRHGALEGDYDGLGASASVGAGVGANALIGGSNRTVTLQPLSIQIQGGLNIAAGVSSLRLHSGI